MIAIFGAGSVGCYVGGRLAASGTPVTLIGRAALETALADGLTLVDLAGRRVALSASAFTITSSPSALAKAQTVLVCVRSPDTDTAARTVQAHATTSAQVISLQNGVTNVKALADTLGSEHVVPGMVGFNVVRSAPGCFTQTTQGEIIVGPEAGDFIRLLTSASIRAVCRNNMEGIQWSKLLLNLNNALNTLSGLGLKAQLEDRGWRTVLAACISEGLAVARVEGIKLERVGRIHPRILPFILRLPDLIFLRIAQSMLRIDPAARSSMADDYCAGRVPEVDWLNGHIVKLAKKHGLSAPVNRGICRLVHDAFAADSRPALRHSAASVLDVV